MKNRRMSKKEYLSFEEMYYSSIDAECVHINRVRWEVTEQDLVDFYGENYLNYRVIFKNNKYIKVRKRKNNQNSTVKTQKNNVLKEKKLVQKEQKLVQKENFTKEEVFENSKLFNYIYTKEDNLFVRFRNKKTGEYSSFATKDLSIPDRLYKILNSDKFSTNKDMMYSLNIYNNMKNATYKDLFMLNLIAIDVDFGEVKRFIGENPTHLINVLEDLEFDKTIPRPQIVEYGRHLRLIYALEKVPATSSSKTLAKRLATIIGERLADYGGSAQPLTTYARFIGSVNSKTGQTVNVLYLNQEKYTLKDLQSKWLGPLPKWYPEWKANRNRKVVNLSKNFKEQADFYKYNELRINDFYRIQRYFDYDCEGFKRFLCFQLRNHLILNGHANEEAKRIMLEFNKNFKKPLRSRIIEIDTKNVERKQYHYKSETILNFIGISKEDEILLNLEGILSKDEIKRRNNERTKIYQKKKMRNENGLTKTEEKRLMYFEQISTMELKGMSYKSIAKELGVDLSNMLKKIKKVYPNINYADVLEKNKEKRQII